MTTLALNNLSNLLLGPISLEFTTPCCIISGPSGSGKTLLLRAIADLDPHTGQVFLDTVEQNTLPAPNWRRLVAYLPAESQWWADRVGMHFHLPDLVLLERLGFGPEVLDWEVARLSSGERQRLALARMLALAPRALLLDEPTVNLDQTNRELVERIVTEHLKTHAAIALWVSHDLEQTQRIGNSHWHIHNETLLEDSCSLAVP